MAPGKHFPKTGGGAKLGSADPETMSAGAELHLGLGFVPPVCLHATFGTQKQRVLADGLASGHVSQSLLQPQQQLMSA